MRIGTIDIERPIVLAPMEDVTDMAFRLVCKRLGADIVYTEFVNSEGLIRDSLKTMRKMEFREEERPFGIQIYGGEESSMEKAAAISESYNPDLIDINCGCWVKDVAMRGAGAGLLRDLKRMERIVLSVVKNVKLPVTVKTRLGWDSENIRIVEVAKMVEQTGAKALTIHCLELGPKGIPESPISLRFLLSRLPFPFRSSSTVASIRRRKSEKCSMKLDAMVSCSPDRLLTILGFSGIQNTSSQVERYSQFQASTSAFGVLIEHLNLSIELKGERRAVIEFRKYYSGYLRNLPNASKVRSELMNYSELSPIVDYVYQYTSWLKSTDLVGVAL